MYLNVQGNQILWQNRTDGYFFQLILWNTVSHLLELSILALMNICIPTHPHRPSPSHQSIVVDFIDREMPNDRNICRLASIEAFNFSNWFNKKALEFLVLLVCLSRVHYWIRIQFLRVSNAFIGHFDQGRS